MRVFVIFTFIYVLFGALIRAQDKPSEAPWLDNGMNLYGLITVALVVAVACETILRLSFKFADWFVS